MKSIRNTRGSSYIYTCAIVLVLIMILSVVLFYASTKTVIETTRDNTRRILDSFVMKNSIEIYDRIKQGNDFCEDIEDFFYKSLLSSELSLDFDGNCYYTVGADGETVCRMTSPEVTFKEDRTLQLQAEYALELPVRFAGRIIYWFRVPIKVGSSLILK